MITKIITAILCFILIVNKLIIAQNEQYKFVRFDVSKGLSHNQVNCILKDKKGFMWFGTMSGLNRFDGYSSKVFKHDISNPQSIDDNYIISIFEDPIGKIWVNTRNGLNIYNPETETFSQGIYSYLKHLSISDNSLSNIIKDKKGNYWLLGTRCRLYKYFTSSKKNVKIDLSYRSGKNSGRDVITAAGFNSKNELWVVYQSGLLLLMNSENFKTIYRSDFLRKFNDGETFNYYLFIDSDNDLWIYCPDSPIGAFYFNSATKSFVHIDKGTGKNGLNTSQVRSIVQDNKGLIWIGTDHGGINLLNKNNFSISYVLNNPEDQSSLSQNSIYSLYKDNLGIIWVGTYKKGVDYFHEDIFRFGLFKHLFSDPQSLGYDDVNCFCEDHKGNIWIGTNGGGLNYYNRHTGKFSHYIHEAGNSNSLSNNVIVSLFEDKQNRLWIGTYCGGLDCFDGRGFIHFLHDPSNSASISGNSIWSIFEDSKHDLWIGTLGGGLDKFDRNKKVFYHYRAGTKNSVHSNYISSITEDKDRNLWVGTAEGIDELERNTGMFVHYRHSNNDPSSLSNNNVLAVACDCNGNVWFGTRDGLNFLKRGKHRFKIFREADGLPDNSILTVLTDNLGKVWFGTPNGISSLIIRKDKRTNKEYFFFKNFDESDGLQGKEFNEKAACKTSQGELLFGGANGFNVIRPSSLTMSRIVPRVVFTDLQIFNKSVGVNEEIKGKAVLKKSISETSEIVLKYSDNVFSIEFAALNFLHPEKVKYIYKLKGFSKTWLTADGANRRITFTNLNPGEYYFIVKASNNDGLWNGQEAKLKITVLPPFWKSNFAIVLYVIFVVGLLFLLRWLILQRERMNYRNEQELQEAQRRHDMDMLKIKFFTNVSHEFRTPLTLIFSPLEQVLKKFKNPEQEKQLTMVYRNARRLLNLVNQLLDFRKMEVDEIKLHPTFGDIIQFIKETTLTFSDISEKKNIHLSFYSTISGFSTLFDHEKLERILFNLLSNAFKFTPSKGSVAVEVEFDGGNNSKILSEEEKNRINWLIINVKDTGIGISKEKHEQIFERFFQNDLPGSLMNQGTGIGLALTKEYVKLQGGTIEVNSAPGKGSCFSLHLPFTCLEEESISGEASYLAIDSEENSDEPTDIQDFKVDKKKPLVLIVEDNEDFRFYLKDNLKQHYNILEAENGEEGWERILRYMPDLIVSDIMMPEMDGIDLCHRIKTDHRTFDTPVILLTARITDEQKLEGFENGADEYITKPFSFEILESRIKNLIAQRQNLRKSYQKKIEIKSEEIKIDSADEKFIKKATELVEKELSHPEFSVETLSRELGMSRVHLYKKVLALTGKTPIEFIRYIRLNRAAQLLEKSDLSVSEVAYKIGFNNPRYFARYFKAEFKTLPSMYASLKHQGKENSEEN